MNPLDKNKEDPLDEIFREKINGDYGSWFFKNINLDFLMWLNRWGNETSHVDYQVEEDKKSFRRGYHQAMRDVYNKLDINFRIFDKRTKDGYSKK